VAWELPVIIKSPIRCSMKKPAGFTLIEILVTVVISGILFGGGIAAFRGIGARQNLKQAGIEFQSNLRSFQQKALSSEKPSDCSGTLDGFRVQFDPDLTSYSVKAECSTNDGLEIEFSLTEGVKFTSEFSDMVFYTLKAEVEGAPQTITLTNGSLQYQVIIESSGVIRGGML